MSILRWGAIVAMVAMTTSNLAGQDFARITVSGQSGSYNDVSQAVYASLSDAPGSEQTVGFESQTPVEPVAAFKTIHDMPAAPAIATVQTISDLGADNSVVALPQPIAPSNLPSVSSADVYLEEATDAGNPIGQVSLLAPSCGVAGCTDPACGLPEATCGLPDVTCGLPEPSCGATACTDCGGQLQCGALCTRECPTCCGVGTHCTNFYGELLYLRARNAEVAYAVPADGPIVGLQPSPVQVGNLGVLDPDYEVGFRAGINVALDTVSSLDIRYTLFESLTENEISATAPIVLRSLVTHPNTASASQDGLSALASLEVDFDLIDFSYRHLLKCCDLYSANYVVGARYAKLEQQFASEFVKQGLETVTTDIDFDGGGLRLGLETARYSCRNNLHVYANGYASFMAGRFRAHYFQGQAFDPTVVNAEWEAGRIVPILDLEAGVGWTSDNGKLSLSAGYLVSAWFNTVTTQDFIHAIQSNNYLGLSDTTTFDGLQARFSYRF